MSPVDLHKAVLAISIFLILSGLCLTAVGLFSPSWQIVDIRELQAEHQHGVWWDCVRSERYVIPLNRVGESPSSLKCAYKFDLLAQEALASSLDGGEINSKEMQLHRFLPQHKAVIFFATFTFIFGLISIVVGLCSPCFTPNALLYSVALFMTTSCSALADIIFFFAAMRIETRFVQGALDIYEQRIGYAAVLHVFASALFLFALLTSIVAAYLLISAGGTSECCCYVTEYRYDYGGDTYSRWKSHGVCAARSFSPTNERSFLRRCDDEKCRPFVVITADDS